MDDLHVVQPLIVPVEYNESGQFPAPFERLAHPALALTWVALTAPDWMLYVKPAVAHAWEEQGVDWRARALANLRAVDAGRTWTHEKVNDWGDLVWVAMMHDDGLGCARLLCREELEGAFPSGYRVALPDRSCGLALSLGATEAQQAEFEHMVSGCFAGATTPMLGEILEPDELLPRAP